MCVCIYLSNISLSSIHSEQLHFSLHYGTACIVPNKKKTLLLQVQYCFPIFNFERFILFLSVTLLPFSKEEKKKESKIAVEAEHQKKKKGWTGHDLDFISPCARAIA